MSYGDRPPFVTASGHVRLYEPEHPLANRWGHVMEHRKVAWDAGILTDPALVVHHVNHDPSDNRPENLQVMTPSAHAAHHSGQQVKRTREEYLASERERSRRRYATKTCEACGREYMERSEKPYPGCSNQCIAVLKRRAGWRPAYLRDCEVCGREFRCRVGDGRFCGSSCRAQANRTCALAILRFGPDPCTGN